MKKYIFILFLIFCLFSFSANDGKVTIGLKAQVLDNTNLLLEISAIDNAGADNKSLTFDFGNLIKGVSEEELKGTFQVRLLKNSNEILFDNAPSYKLIENSNDLGVQTITKTTNNNVILTYTLQEILGQKNTTKNFGTLIINANAKGNNVNVGTFLENNVYIKITLTNQTTGL